MRPRTGRLGARDLADVVALEAYARERPWSAATLAEELVRPDRHYLGAWNGDELVGFGALHLGPDEAEVLTLVVAPPHRGRGIGRLLVGRLVEEAEARGSSSLHLEVAASNTPAMTLYRSLNFTDIGLRPAYYPGGDDAVLLVYRFGPRAPVLRRGVSRSAGTVTAG